MPRSKYTQGKDGLWRTAVRTGNYDKNGRPISVRLSSSKSSADLEKKVRDLKYKIERGYVYISQGITLGEYAPLWLETKKSRSKATYQEYEYFVKSHLGNLETMRIDYIRSADVQKHINSYSAHPSMCKKILLTLRQIFDMAISEDLILKNPCHKISIPRSAKKEKRTLTPKECTLVKNAIGLTPKERALLHLFYGSGLRPAEIYALTWEDINFKDHTVDVNKALQFGRTGKTSVGLPKTNQSIRTIPVPDFVIDSLAAYKRTYEGLDTQYLFGLNGALYANRTGYDNQIEKVLTKLDLSEITAYSFRHNFCTMCYNNHIDVKICQHLLGHSDTKMVLEVYYHLDKTNATLSAALNNIDFG